MSYQKFIAIGRLTKDVELKTSQSNKPFANFSIAVNRIFDKENVDFFNCVTFGKSAEYLAKYGSKGAQVLIEASVQIDNKDGKYYTNVVCQNVSLVGGKSENQTQTTQKQEVAEDNFDKDVEDAYTTSKQLAAEDDLPF